MRPRQLRGWLLLLAAAALAAACSSGGSTPTAGRSSTPGSPRSVDESTVDSALAQVVTGLRAATSISSSDSIPAAARSLRTASADLRSAGDALNPSPAGVPAAQSLALSTSLLRISSLLGQASTCLAAQSHAKHPSTKPCLPPLRQAEQRDARVAHGLISLAVYGSKSPRVIESELVAALRGK